MPHYKNGDEAKVGDRLIFTTREYRESLNGYADVKREGMIVVLTPSSTTCNAAVVYPHLDIIGQGSTQEVRLPRLATHTGHAVRVREVYLSHAEATSPPVGCGTSPATYPDDLHRKPGPNPERKPTVDNARATNGRCRGVASRGGWFPVTESKEPVLSNGQK